MFRYLLWVDQKSNFPFYYTYCFCLWHLALKSLKHSKEQLAASAAEVPGSRVLGASVSPRHQSCIYVASPWFFVVFLRLACAWWVFWIRSHFVALAVLEFTVYQGSLELTESYLPPQRWDQRRVPQVPAGSPVGFHFSTHIFLVSKINWHLFFIFLNSHGNFWIKQTKNVKGEGKIEFTAKRNPVEPQSPLKGRELRRKAIWLEVLDEGEGWKPGV